MKVEVLGRSAERVLLEVAAGGRLPSGSVLYRDGDRTNWAFSNLLYCPTELRARVGDVGAPSAEAVTWCSDAFLVVQGRLERLWRMASLAWDRKVLSAMRSGGGVRLQEPMAREPGEDAGAFEMEKVAKGYVRIFVPLPGRRGGWHWLHRLVVELELGGRLPRGCDVHHRDRVRDNNELSNLEIYPDELHDALHGPQRDRERAERECREWSDEAFRGLQTHYMLGRMEMPDGWGTVDGIALLAEEARGGPAGQSILVLKGRFDRELRDLAKQKNSPAEIAEKLGCTVEAVLTRIQSFIPKTLTKRL